jgi:hypothetical protein
VGCCALFCLVRNELSLCEAKNDRCRGAPLALAGSNAFLIMALIRTLFWFAIFIGSTFVFTVLFEHGPTNFAVNSKKEAESLQKLFMGDVKKKADGSDHLLK